MRTYLRWLARLLTVAVIIAITLAPAGARRALGAPSHSTSNRFGNPPNICVFATQNAIKNQYGYIVAWVTHKCYPYPMVEMKYAGGIQHMFPCKYRPNGPCADQWTWDTDSTVSGTLTGSRATADQVIVAHHCTGNWAWDYRVQIHYQGYYDGQWWEFGWIPGNPITLQANC